MLRSNTHTLSDLIKLYKRKHKLEQGIQESRLLQTWQEVVGKVIANKTSDLEIRNRKLYVHVSSPVIRNELMILKLDILRRLNEESGGNTIDDIFFR
jgi:predicted nucleic acid-binding Zn ribbon protein